MAAGNIEPHAQLTFWPKGAPLARRQSDMAEPFDEVLALHPGAREIDPSKIGRLEIHDGQSLDAVDRLVQQLAIGVEIGNELIEPLVAAPLGGLSHQHSEPVVRNIHCMANPRHPLPQRRIGDQHATSLDPSDVEGLTGGDKRDQPA